MLKYLYRIGDVMDFLIMLSITELIYTILFSIVFFSKVLIYIADLKVEKN